LLLNSELQRPTANRFRKTNQVEMPIESSSGKALLVDSLYHLTPIASFKHLPRVLTLLPSLPKDSSSPAERKRLIDKLLVIKQ
jgi:hypothetical protein